MLRGERLTDRDQIVAGVKARRYFTDILAKGLPIAKERRPCDGINLGACVIDIVFLADLIASCIEQGR